MLLVHTSEAQQEQMLASEGRAVGQGYALTAEQECDSAKEAEPE